MKVFVVTTGDYSDERVCGVFSSMEMVDKFRSTFKDTNDPTEWEVDGVNLNPFSGLTRFLVRMDADGNVTRVEEYNCAPQDYPHVAQYNECRDYTDKLIRGDGYCWAKDEAHAVKIIAEHRAQFIASGKRDELIEYYKGADGIRGK